MIRTTAALAVLCLFLGGCGVSEENRALSGAGIGALGGALVGGPVGALAGAGIGAATGAVTEPEDVNLGTPIWDDPKLRR
jgi:hypothetical protein